METRPRPFGFLSRRTLLKASLTVGSLTLMGGAAWVWVQRAPKVDGLSVLGDREYQTFAAIASAHFPRGGAFETGAEDLDLARIFDRFLQGEPSENVRDLKRALLLVELAPLGFGRLSTFSRLSPTDRASIWESVATSDQLVLRQVGLAFRKFMNMVFFDQASVWPHIGYPGPLLGGGAK